MMEVFVKYKLFNIKKIGINIRPYTTYFLSEAS